MFFNVHNQFSWVIQGTFMALENVWKICLKLSFTAFNVLKQHIRRTISFFSLSCLERNAGQEKPSSRKVRMKNSPRVVQSHCSNFTVVNGLTKLFVSRFNVRTGFVNSG